MQQQDHLLPRECWLVIPAMNPTEHDVDATNLYGFTPQVLDSNFSEGGAADARCIVTLMRAPSLRSRVIQAVQVTLRLPNLHCT